MEPKTIIKSRHVLQTFKNGGLNKYIAYDRLLALVWSYLSRVAIEGKTKFVYFIPEYEVRNKDFVSEEFVEILKNEYPDCLINYTETTGVNGNIIERALTIDWS